MNFLIIALTSLFVLKSQGQPISAKTQSLIVKKIASEVIRLDGEGLLSRKGNRKPFREVVQELSKKALDNNSLYDFHNTFQQLDGAYTNLHSRAIFSKRVDGKIIMPWYLDQSVWLFSEVGDGNSKLKVYNVKDKTIKVSEGDEVVAINGRSVIEWFDENFEFCKFPLKAQCDRQFSAHLLSLRLSWKGDTPLVYSIKSNDEIVDVEVKSFRSEQNQDPLRKRCDYKSEERYPGFKLKYMGFYACIYESEANSGIALLRISSFQYNRRKNSKNPFNEIHEEVAALEKFWLKKSDKYKELILDLINNTGGNLPVSYYQLLFHGKFQEQFVRFKKTEEFENDDLRKWIFWTDKSHELSYQRRLKNGSWNKLKYGEFTAPEPMFCADQEKPCEDSSFSAKKHSFNGNVSVMLNEKCVSSCDGFVWAVKNYLNAKLYGFPQAADSAYSRLRIDAIKDKNSPDGFKIIVNPQRAELDKNHIVGQVVAVSRTSDENGNSFNGNPLDLEKLVPYKVGVDYHRSVLKTILESLNF